MPAIGIYLLLPKDAVFVVFVDYAEVDPVKGYFDPADVESVDPFDSPAALRR